jgi:hypothetical protein
MLFGFMLLSSDTAIAQLFGPRSIGNPLQGRTRSGSGIGEVQGNERFLRGNRGRSDFVGSDSGDRRGFVGNEQATGSASTRTSTDGLQRRTDQGREINQVIPALAKKGMYYPTLRLGFSLPTTAATDLGQRLGLELASSSRFSDRSHFEVLVEGTTAILRGEVSSAAERDVAEVVARFEPGIYQVRNELKVLRPGESVESPQQEKDSL